MHIREIDTRNRRDVRKFIQLPFELYRNSPEWTPPLVSSVKLTLDRRRHPFYSDSAAAFFLAEEGESVVGRIAVLDNRRYNNYIQGKVAFFYHFDTIEDGSVVEGLFAAAKAWAGKRGLEVLKGPKGFVRSDAYGVLIEGFEHSASMGIPYNFSYYPSLLERIGAEKEVDYFTGYMIAQDELPERLFRLAEQIKARRGFWVKNFTTKRELRTWIPRIQEVNNRAFTQVWGYYPVDDAEIRMIGQQLLEVSDPRLLKVVMKEDEIAGFAFVFPDVSEALRKVRGRLFPFGWVPALVSLRTTHSLLANEGGLLPKYTAAGAL
ncbi:MAG: hypothetical protein J7M39_04075, partial [Anaerolineae bacterium]|nr:hypothetical protein [Anaerolineae bacterium]